MTLTLVIQLEDPKMWLVARGTLDAARRQRMSLLILGFPSEIAYASLTEEDLFQHFGAAARSSEGILFASTGRPLQNAAKVLHDQGKPVVLLARKIGEVPCVINNNTDAICELVHKLVEKGHRAIAYLAGPSESIVADERMSGYWQGLKECGLEVDESLIIRGDYSENTAYHVTRDALAHEQRFTALIAVNDLSALGAMRALAETGLSPGADVEVTGFDNIPATHWSQPPLSTFDTGLYQMGYQACIELGKIVRGEPFQTVSIVPARFVPRLSTWESEGDAGRGHPLGQDYLEHRFLYDRQMDQLRLDVHAAALLTQLGQSTTSHESFLQTLRELLAEVKRMEMNPGCLFSLLGGTTETGDTDFHEIRFAPRQTVNAAMGLLTTAFFYEQTRQADVALRYHSATIRLRELPFAEATEDSILDTMNTALRDLDVVRAGLFLHASGEPSEENSKGIWHDWELKGSSVREPGRPCECFSADLIESGSSERSWLVLPMLHGQASLGLAVLDANTEFLPHALDLIRQFTVALHAARLQSALSRANAELVETSRMAGLAEMATGVLHNIGNALNSVNTSCSLAIDLVRGSKLPGVSRVAQTLKSHASELSQYLNEDPKGAQVLPYLDQLGSHLESEQKRLLAELEGLRGMIDHINEIVAAQQSHAQISSLVEELSPLELLEFSLRFAEASLTRHQIRVTRDYSQAANVRVQRQKAVQILTNLIRNAKEALDETRESERRLTLCVKPGRPGFVEVCVADNGPGIAVENLIRIFNFGFTTKKGGHGYGLHNAALAAKEMGGSLTAGSDGLGKGARFILELPGA